MRDIKHWRRGDAGEIYQRPQMTGYQRPQIVGYISDPKSWDISATPNSGIYQRPQIVGYIRESVYDLTILLFLHRYFIMMLRFNCDHKKVADGIV